MDIVLEVFGRVILALLWWIIAVPLILVGEITIYILTLGKRKISWDAHLGKHGGDFVALTEISFWVGAFTLISFGLLIKYLLF